MDVTIVAAWLAAALLVLVALFQLGLAAGAPWGAAAWGGEHRVLAGKLRVSSAVAAAVLLLAANSVLRRAGITDDGDPGFLARASTWVFAAYFCLNTLANLASKSPIERAVMTPIAATIAICFIIVALS